jgi:hypothetical protein
MFLNLLDFPDVLHIVFLCLLYGVDYQIYTCISLFKHMERPILLASREKELVQFFAERTITSYAIADNMPYMISLQEKYRECILSNMNST